MKIHAIIRPDENAEKREFLIAATGKEIAYLFGKFGINIYGTGNALSRDDVRVGTVINVDAAYQYLTWIYKHRERFERIATELRGAADSIDKFPALFEELSIPKPDEIKKAG